MARQSSKIWTLPDSGPDLLVRIKVSSFRITTLNFFSRQGDVGTATFLLNRTSHQDLLPAPKIRGWATKVARVSNWATRTFNHHPVQTLALFSAICCPTSQIWRSKKICDLTGSGNILDRDELSNDCPRALRNFWHYKRWPCAGLLWGTD